MKPSSPVAEVLDYLKDLGYTHLRKPAAQAAPAEASGSAPRLPQTPEPRTDEVRPPAPPARVSRASPNAPTSVPAAALVERLHAAADEAAVCRACRLCETRNKVVFGSGPADARLMFVGEGPGAEEDRQGLPFVGRAGELLSKIVQAIDLRRDQVYIANIVKCRPPENREPAPDEIAACRGFLDRQIDAVRPQVLVALGRIAAQSLLGNDLTLGRMRGQWHELRGIPLMVTYHPAALLRNEAYKRPTWEDMKLVRARLRELEAAVPGN